MSATLPDDSAITVPAALTFNQLAASSERRRTVQRRRFGGPPAPTTEPSPSSATLGRTPRRHKRIEQPNHRSRKRTRRENKAEADRQKQRPFRRDTVLAKERDDRELPQSPAADRDRDEVHADHYREQHGGVGDGQHEALGASDRPDHHDSEDVDEASEGQDQR